MIKQLIDGLNALLMDEDLTDAKLREASEGLLPDLADYLNGSGRSDGAGLILAERIDQVHKHGRTVKSDVSQNKHGQLCEAALMLISSQMDKGLTLRRGSEPYGWSYDAMSHMMAKTYRERLIIAGALIAAEIDRLDHNTTSKI